MTKVREDYANVCDLPCDFEFFKYQNIVNCNKDIVPSHITIDKYGSCVWKLLDGKNTVFDIVNSMKSNFPNEQDKMLNRVVTFLYTLQVNKYIQ